MWAFEPLSRQDAAPTETIFSRRTHANKTSRSAILARFGTAFVGRLSRQDAAPTGEPLTERVDRLLTSTGSA